MIPVEVRLGLFEVIGTDVGHDHLHAIAQENLRHAEADAARPAGDKGLYPATFFIVFYVLSWDDWFKKAARIFTADRV